MSSADTTPAERPQVNVVVCVDDYGCGRWYHRGRDAGDVLRQLQQAARERDDHRIQVSTSGCILGCTYGPRFDVARRWSGEKTLYGSITGEATVTRRGQVSFAEIPDRLDTVLSDHLPESAVPVAELCGTEDASDADLLRRILLECSRGLGDGPVGLGECVVMVHNEAATASVPATLANLEMVDGSGRSQQDSHIAVLTTDGDGHIALQLSRIRQVEFSQRTLGNGMPSYAIWLRDHRMETVYRIYLRRADNPDHNPLRHRLFTDLIAKYGAKVNL